MRLEETHTPQPTASEFTHISQTLAEVLKQLAAQSEEPLTPPGERDRILRRAA